MSAGKVLGVIIILGILMFGMIFFMGAIAVTDANVDVTGTDYEGTYNTSKTISIQSMGMLNVIMLIIVAAGIVFAVKTLY